jgi:uncharacterized membrane protein YdjX (TVP38/TMEM64 family)
VLFVSLVLVGFILKFTELGAIFDEDWIDTYVRGQSQRGYLIFICMGLVFTALGLPRQIISFLAGYAFGFVQGVMLALVSTFLGCIGAFYFARFIGRKFVVHKFKDKVQRIDVFLNQNPLAMTLLIRFLPLGSNLASNLAAGVSGVRGGPFFLGSLIGYLPQTIVFSLVGSGIGVEPIFRISLGASLFVLSGILGIYLFRRYRRGMTFDDEIERALGVNIDDPPLKTNSQ